MIRVLAGGMVIMLLLLGLQTYRLDESKATEAIALKNNEELAIAMGGLLMKHESELEARENALRAERDLRLAGEERRRAAEARYRRISSESRKWAATPVPSDVVASLCIKPGSCTEVPTASEAASRPDGGNTGTTAKRALRLINESLRDGVEDLRSALSQCNAKLAGIRAWMNSVKMNSE